ncbi:MAG: hypothetical protein ACXWVT_13805 [Burkholderiaceae bacterium]
MRVGHDGNERGWRGVLGHIVQHVRDDWPAAIFVACLFAVLDHAVGWLDAINGHGFVAIGNAAGMPTVRGDASVKAVVVLIDQTAAETRYLDRSPLDRCQLLADLGAVYAAMKKRESDLLVVDLDLSPARWLLTDEGRTTREAGCQNELYRTVKEAASSEPKVRTVLMSPIEAVDPVLLTEQKAWRADMEQSAVTIGHAVLPVKYGLVIKQYCHPDSLAGAAYTLAAMRNNTTPTSNRCTELEYIDPRKYLSGVIPLPVSAPPGASKTLGERLDDLLAAEDANPAGRATGVQAVFFGAAFGQGDTFVTPLGELYGVEIHAAGFLSFLDPVKAVTRLIELMVDIFYGFFFGFLIAHFWSKYFELRLSGDSDHRLKAPFWLFGLGATVAFFTGLLTLLSWWLLARHGLWLSPIPMAIGMLIESFVSGAVAQGIREADALKGQGRPSRLTFREGARKFFGGDIFLLARKGKRLSAALLAVRLGFWTAIVAGALVLALLPH